MSESLGKAEQGWDVEGHTEPVHASHNRFLGQRNSFAKHCDTFFKDNIMKFIEYKTALQSVLKNTFRNILPVCQIFINSYKAITPVLMFSLKSTVTN